MTRILLVEKDEAEAETIRQALRDRHDWEVVQVGSVLDAIRTAGESTFDAAILDYDLPDGTGLDLLDFLRIGSPGIRIVMLSSRGSEQLALQALSHGAGDWLVKDRRLGQELPRRVEALLDHVDPRAAFVETLTPGGYDPRDIQDAAPEPGPAPAAALLHEALGHVVERMVEGPVFAAAVFDHRGRPLATRLVPPLDPDGVGFGLASIHAQVGGLWAASDLKPTSYVALVHVEGGLLGLTAVPGPCLVALLLAQATPHEKALRALTTAAKAVSDAMRR